MRLTCMMDVATNPFEELNRFRNPLPLRIEVFDIEYLRENLEEG